MARTRNLGIRKVSVSDSGKEVSIAEAFDTIDSALADFITGLRLEWISVSSIKVKTGAAAVIGDDADEAALVVISSDITTSSISLGNNTWGHVYLYDDNGAPAVEVNTTAPVNYFGSAYQKTGDATRRYLGSIRTNGSGNIYNFIHIREWMIYRATSETNVDCSAVVPVTSRFFEAEVQNAATSGNAVMGSSDDGIAGGAATYGHHIVLVGKEYSLRHFLNTSQVCTYWYDGAASGGGFYIDVIGYAFDR